MLVYLASGGTEVAVASIDSEDEGWVTATAVLSLFDFFMPFVILADEVLCSRSGAH